VLLILLAGLASRAPAPMAQTAKAEIGLSRASAGA